MLWPWLSSLTGLACTVVTRDNDGVLGLLSWLWSLQFLLASLEGSGQYTDVEHFTEAGQSETYDVHLQHAASSGGNPSVPSALTLWEVEREQWSTGGVVAFGDSIRLRHLVTSRYLVVVRVRRDERLLSHASFALWS